MKEVRVEKFFKETEQKNIFYINKVFLLISTKHNQSNVNPINGMTNKSKTKDLARLARLRQIFIIDAGARYEIVLLQNWLR